MKYIAASLAFLIFASPCFAQTYTLKKSQVFTVKGVGSCGYISNKWSPVSKTKKKYKKISGSAELRSVCKSLLKKSKLSMSKLPDTSSILAENTSSSAARSVSPAVSGVPPTLAQIASQGAENVFWRSGIVSAINSGSPSAEQCTELFGSSADGSSSGFPGCYMAQETGFVMENIIQSGTSLCYMKNFPTREVQNDGGFTVIDGSLPGGNPAQLFSPPSGNSPRYIKIHIGSSGQEESGPSIGIFKIYSQSQNEANGDQYRYDLVFCEEGASSTQEFEKTRVTLAGELITRSQNSHGGGSASSYVKALLTRQGGDFVVNPSLGRTVEFSMTNNGEGYKSSITLSGDNTVRNKVYSSFGGSTRKGYSIARFSGDSAPSLRFLEGAYKESNASFGNFSIATEYRDSYYAATQSSSFATELSEVDIGSDEFYQTPASSSDDRAPISCNQDVSVEIQVNMESSAMQSVAAICEAERIDGMDFCSSNALREAQQKYGQVCQG